MTSCPREFCSPWEINSRPILPFILLSTGSCHILYIRPSNHFNLNYSLTGVMFKSLKHIAFDQASLEWTQTDCKHELQWHMHAKVMEWNSRVIPGGGKAKRWRWKEGWGSERQRREINGVSPLVNCLLVYAEGSRESISEEAQVESSLLFPLISGRLDPLLLLLSLSAPLLLQSHDCWEGIKKNGHVKESLTNWILTGHAGRQSEAGRARSKNTADKVTSCLS